MRKSSFGVFGFIFLAICSAWAGPPDVPTITVSTSFGPPPPNCPPVPESGSLMNAHAQSINSFFNSSSNVILQQSDARQAHISSLGTYATQVAQQAVAFRARACELSQQAASLSESVEIQKRQAMTTPVSLSAETEAKMFAPISELVRQAPTRPRNIINLTTIPDPDESQLGYDFRSTGQHRDEVSRLYKDLYKINPQFGKQIKAKELGLISAKEADQSYHLGNEEEGNFFRELGKGFLDVAVGIDPITGLGRSAYELFYGRNLITGAKLNGAERSFAFLGIATAGGSKFLTQAGRGIWKIYQGAAHLLQERQAVETAIRAGERLVEQGGRVLNTWSKRHKITHFETAAEANARLGYGNPAYLEGSHLVHFRTVSDQTFVRVHTNGIYSRIEGTWLVRRGEIQGLTPQQFANKLNLEHIPTHMTDVHIPSGTPMSRGMTNLNQWETQLSHTLEGQVQYRIEERYVRDWFRNTRPIGDVLQ